MSTFAKIFTPILSSIFLFSCSGEKTDAAYNSNSRSDGLFGKSEAFEKIMEDPETAKDYCERGKILMTGTDRKMQGALDDFSRSIELDPAYYEAYYERGHVYTELQEYEKALADYTSAIKIKPDYIKAYKQKAFVFYKLKNYDKAVNEYSRIIDLNPAPAGYYSSVTDEDTKKTYRGNSKQTEINELKEAYENRAYMFSLLKNYEKSFEDCAKALEISGSKHHIYNLRANLHMELKETQEACDDWRLAADHGSLRALDSLKKYCSLH